MKNTIGRLWIGMAVIAGLNACASSPDRPDSGTTVAPVAGSALSGADPSGHGADEKNAKVASATPNLPAGSATAVKSAPWGDAVVATVNKRSPVSISMGELVQPLIEAHGLDMLLYIAQRDLAKQGADEAGIVVTPDDFKAERERFLGLIYRELDAKIQDQIDQAEKEKKPERVKQLQDEMTAGHQQLLKQFYQQKQMTSTEFDIWVQINAYLRKIAEPQLKDKITDELLHAEFAARYGEQVRVRHIEMKRPQDAIEVKRRLAAGEKFENVAQELSTNPDASIGGEMLPFSREAPWPKVFKDVAFALKVGEVSDPVEANGTYQLIKLEERIMPKAVVFEQQRDILFRDVHEQLMEGLTIQMRRQIVAAIQGSLKISDPVMNKQFQERLDVLKTTIQGREKAEQEMAKERESLRLENEKWARQQAATHPSTLVWPDSNTTTQPAATVPERHPVTASAPGVPVAPSTAPAPAAPRPVPAPSPPAVPAPLTRPATAPAAPRAALRATTAPTTPRAAPPATRPG